MPDKSLEYEMLKLLSLYWNPSPELKNMLIEGIFSPQTQDYGKQSKE